MASSHDSQARRSSSHHRMSASSNSGSSLPIRQSYSKHHSHSLSVGSINPTHRVTRRKSMSSNGSNLAAVAAAVQEAGEGSFVMPLPSSHRRSLTTKSNSSVPKVVDGLVPTYGNYPSPPSSLPNHTNVFDAPRTESNSGMVITDGPSLSAMQSPDSPNKARMRRASEGSQLVKGEGKRVTAGELRCDKCGKGYKHSSCLTKHLWEHTPEWSYTSKLLISKHQQVQLLEAASVLVQMNQDPEPLKAPQSPHSSASPAASGSSGLRDEEAMSSTDTTPPPQTSADDPSSTAPLSARPRTARSKRYSSASSGFSRSYQSAPAFAGSAPSVASSFTHYHPGAEEDEAGLAAAVELLSCSFGTPRSGPVTLPPDVPPVPPLPARFVAEKGGAGFASHHGHGHDPSEEMYPPEYKGFKGREVNMDGSEESVADEEDDDFERRGRSDVEEEYDGVFGRMEE